MKLTKKDIINTFKYVYQVNYGELQYLLNNCTKLGNNYGTYGYNWSAYLLDRETVIITGYCNKVGKKLNDDFVQAYDKKVQFILQDTLLNNKQQTIDQLIQEFIFTIKNTNDCIVD